MYSHKLISLVLLAACYVGVSTSTPAFAEDTIQDQLQRINDNIAILNARKQELELRAMVVSKQAEIDRITYTDNGNIDRTRQPVVQAIEGADGKLVATLAFGSGIQQNVRNGDPIPGGWQISKIAVDAVYITRGKDKVRLAYGHEPPPAPQVNTTVPPLNPINPMGR